MMTAETTASKSSQASRYRRAIYARAMGIDILVPRKPLAGAGEHTYFPLPDASEQAASAGLEEKVPAGAGDGKGLATASRQPAGDSSARRALRESLAGAEAKKPAGQREAAPVKIPAGEVSQDPPGSLSPRFELALCGIDDLLVLDDISSLAVAPSVYQNWLQALALAVGRKSTASLHAGNRLGWPDALAGVGGARPKNAELALTAAREVVQAWLQRQSRVQASAILLLGNNPNLLLDDAAIELLRQQKALSAEVHVIRAGASVEIWQSVEAKRKLWSQLALLCR